MPSWSAMRGPNSATIAPMPRAATSARTAPRPPAEESVEPVDGYVPGSLSVDLFRVTLSTWDPSATLYVVRVMVSGVTSTCV